MNNKKIIIFTDLDATLLDENYLWKSATEALNKIKDLGAHLILNSSKTLSEISLIRNDLQLIDPVIAENGAVVGIPQNLLNKTNNKDLFIHTDDSINRNEIISILNSIRNEYNFKFEGFSDWSPATVSEKTNLSTENAYLALDRKMTEPILWMDNKNNYELFNNLIKAKNLCSINGGIFKHIMAVNINKGSSMKKLMHLYDRTYPNQEIISIGLGDSENDIPMLNNSDYAVIISNKSKKNIKIKHKQLVVSKYPGPVGWNYEILKILDNLNVKVV